MPTINAGQTADLIVYEGFICDATTTGQATVQNLATKEGRSMKADQSHPDPNDPAFIYTALGAHSMGPWGAVQTVRLTCTSGSATIKMRPQNLGRLYPTIKPSGFMVDPGPGIDRKKYWDGDGWVTPQFQDYVQVPYERI